MGQQTRTTVRTPGSAAPVGRRRFLQAMGSGAGAALAAGGGQRPVRAAAGRTHAVQPRPSPDVAVVGAGTFGMWTALHLQRLGARVTVVDAYGAGNSRQTSGGETRGVRTSYGGRPHGALWTDWAGRAIEHWLAWDEEGRDRLLPRLFFQTGDLILREAANPYFSETRRHWDALGNPYEVLGPDEVAYRWPWIRSTTSGSRSTSRAPASFGRGPPSSRRPGSSRRKAARYASTAPPSAPGTGGPLPPCSSNRATPCRRRRSSSPAARGSRRCCPS